MLPMKTKKKLVAEFLLHRDCTCLQFDKLWQSVLHLAKQTKKSIHAACENQKTGLLLSRFCTLTALACNLTSYNN